MSYLVMIEIQGKYNKAKVLVTDYSSIEESCYTQILNLLNQEFCKNSNIAIMPDTHAGSGCVIGFTQTVENYVVPNLVGVDIGCGMSVVKIKNSIGKEFFEDESSLKKLDSLIRQHIPIGTKLRSEAYSLIPKTKIKNLIAPVDIERASLSLGTLGGGNHFIEINKDSKGDYYIVVHSGSRHLGIEVCKYYQNLAVKECSKDSFKKELIDNLKRQGKEKLIEEELQKLPKRVIPPKELSYLTGDLKDKYLHDMKIVQEYAYYNRESILTQIVSALGISEVEQKFTTIHNYIDTEYSILRKGAISLQKNEIAIIPINMAYGSLIVKGKGSKDYNYSGPHGAGRLMSRSKAKETLSLEEFKDSMSSVFSTSVSISTIDESPRAYKPAEEILANIHDLCDVIEIIKPIYNLKADVI